MLFISRQHGGAAQFGRRKGFNKVNVAKGKSLKTPASPSPNASFRL